ncbi:hypothetical protein QQ73_15040 [Candidatus Endoriftia persephone str. Guaymas]|nr:hypothetical protein [Candidatus Endoriftia persephone str. Guaymas]
MLQAGQLLDLILVVYPNLLIRMVMGCSLNLEIHKLLLKKSNGFGEIVVRHEKWVCREEKKSKRDLMLRFIIAA